MQNVPRQAMQGQSSPSKPQGPSGNPETTVYLMRQPSPPVYFASSPVSPMTETAQFQTQSFEPRTREKKIIQIKDPNSNKDVTQEILNRETSWSLTSTAGSSSSSTSPDISGQSSRSSTPLRTQKKGEANVRAQFAAQVSPANSHSLLTYFRTFRKLPIEKTKCRFKFDMIYFP